MKGAAGCGRQRICLGDINFEGQQPLGETNFPRQACTGRKEFEMDSLLWVSMGSRHFLDSEIYGNHAIIKISGIPKKMRWETGM